MYIYEPACMYIKQNDQLSQRPLQTRSDQNINPGQKLAALQ